METTISLLKMCAYLQSKKAKMASSNPSVPQTTPAITPMCSSKSTRKIELPPSIKDPPEVDLGENLLIASHPGCKSIRLGFENSPKCMVLFPTTDFVPA